VINVLLQVKPRLQEQILFDKFRLIKCICHKFIIYMSKISLTYEICQIKFARVNGVGMWCMDYKQSITCHIISNFSNFNNTLVWQKYAIQQKIMKILLKNCMPRLPTILGKDNFETRPYTVPRPSKKNSRFLISTHIRK
jgi:hypothetical protein